MRRSELSRVAVMVALPVGVLSATHRDTWIDRFVMGLLRAASDAVLIGAETLRAGAGEAWTPDFIYPEISADVAAMRRAVAGLHRTNNDRCCPIPGCPGCAMVSLHDSIDVSLDRSITS